jgi:hypothetical protein
VINKLLGNNGKISSQDPELLGSSSRVLGPA